MAVHNRRQSIRAALIPQPRDRYRVGVQEKNKAFATQTDRTVPNVTGPKAIANAQRSSREYDGGWRASVKIRTSEKQMAGVARRIIIQGWGMADQLSLIGSVTDQTTTLADQANERTISAADNADLETPL